MASYNKPVYRQSYVEKDRCVRNSTMVKVPGVDVMQGFELSKTEFEQVFMQAAENFEEHERTDSSQQEARPPLRAHNRFNRQRKQAQKKLAKNAAREDGQLRKNNTMPDRVEPPRGFRQPATSNKSPTFSSPEEAAAYADKCRKDAALLQRNVPSDYEGAGELFEKAVDSRAKFGLFCTQENADAHVEYAQNLSKRGLTPEAEYHLRSAADIFRMLNARAARKYGDVLLYMAVVIDRQGSLTETPNVSKNFCTIHLPNEMNPVNREAYNPAILDDFLRTAGDTNSSSSSDDNCGTRKPEPNSSDDENLETNTDEDALYDEHVDSEDELWVNRNLILRPHKAADQLSSGETHTARQEGTDNSREGTKSDAGETVSDTNYRLTCPKCFTLLCLQCQKHEYYEGQFRAIFVQNCVISPGSAVGLRVENGETGKKADDLNVYRPVACRVCNTEVAVQDADDIYHFCNVAY